MPADLRRNGVLACLVAAATLAACGGDDPAADEPAAQATATTEAKVETKSRPAPSEPTSSEDREQIAAVLDKMEAAINDGDADRLCTSVYAFGKDTTKSDCVKVFATVLKQSEARAQITLRNVDRKGDRATVNVVNRGVSGAGSSRQSFRFVKRDGEWRVLFD